MDGSAALEIIKEVGIYRLAGTDGCLCMSCEIQGVHIDVSCRKSSGAISKEIAPDFYGTTLRVYSTHLYEDGAQLRAIADEVVKQLKSESYRIIARFCDFRHDSEVLCTYCGKPRSDPQGYLCEVCLKKPGEYVGHTLAEDNDYRKYDFITPEPD